MKVYDNGIYRDETAEERAEREHREAETHDTQPTAEERIKQLEEQNAMLLECLLEMSEIVYA